ncbi:DUF6221 family protein [Streptomyces ipomoeae]|uniref:DUF6221 family protein n=1 Tax=Streptomyces ipomoeae TaxID=103232 RepID=UPI0029AB4B8F|nr:DUF6221 family protein [Streptomyces ipomoeae]MDX2697583.1 DUF6221 family protein [Streptomyces ipomoeae]MDX2845979.1 DUF6221 family protein [Streptomyces ipomoeae]
MEDLVRWLNTQLDTDAEKARAATQGKWVWSREFVTPPGYHHRTVGPLEPGDAAFIAANDPARVLREINAKRRTLIRCEEEMLSGIPRLVHFAKQTVREMAAVYEQRPGYEAAVRSFLDRPAPREEQRPERARQAPPAKVTDPDELPMAPGCEHWRREHRADLCPMAVCKRCRFLERL